MVQDGTFSHKIDYVTILWENLNPERHPNRITGSKVMPFLRNGWILPIGGASLVKGLGGLRVGMTAVKDSMVFFKASLTG